MIPVPPALVALRQAVNTSYMWRKDGVRVTIPEGANIPTGVKWAPDPALADQLIDAERERTSGYGGAIIDYSLSEGLFGLAEDASYSSLVSPSTACVVSSCANPTGATMPRVAQKNRKSEGQM